MLRNIICLLIFISLSIQTKASHFVAGGEITYKYIGDSTGIARHYLIQLRVFQHSNGANYGTHKVINYSSSCNSGDTLHLPLLGGFPFTGRFIDRRYDCSGSLNINRYKEYIFQNDIVLPINCSDWSFSWIECCRPIGISNIHSPSSTTYVIKAHLNNNYGENSSPNFIHPATRYFCLQNPDTSFFYQGAIESDGDSLYYYLGHPEDVPLPGNPVSFSTGYHVDTPFTTAGGIHLNHSTGTMRFKPTQIEVSTFKINIDEFRFVASLGTWVKIGTIMREVPIVIGSACNNLGENWSISSTPVVNNNIDGTITASCGTKMLTIHTSTPFACETLSADGSDFLVYKKDGTLLPIIGASTNCDLGYSNELMLELFDTLSVNDTMHVVSHTGSDFNTLIGYCGFPLDQGDSLELIVNGCPNISLIEAKDFASTLYPNPTADWVTISFPVANEKVLELFSINGELLYSKTLNVKEYKLNLSSLKSGVYTIRIKTKDHVKYLRLIRQ